MIDKFFHSFYASLEWRFFAFIITNVFLWITTGSFWTATGLALVLQIILFFFHTLWYFWREELHMPLLPHPRKNKKKRRATKRA